MLLLVLSAILTRGVNNIREDMDDSHSSLIVEHGYCSQELVNLLLFGQATSNVFDQCVAVEEKILKGVPFQTDVGLLTRLESMDMLIVGKNFKKPKFPIWIVYNESHYSVLFCKNKFDPKTNQFDIFYYDSLANQDVEIRLTVTPFTLSPRQIRSDSIPLNNIIRTAWPQSRVDWNGTDPLL